MVVHRRAVLASLSLTLWASAAQAQRFELVAPAEHERELAHQRGLSADERDERPVVLRAAFPSLRVVTPRPDADAVKAPLRIEIAFDSGPGTRILPATFRVLYGLLKLDVTERFRAHAQITERGVVAEGTVLPPGAHRLFLQVADDRGRFLERELRFRVEG